MNNEDVTDLESRINRMSDEEICGILVDKEGWQETVYQRAVDEAKKRKISIQSIEMKMERVDKAKKEIEAEPLSKKETMLFLLVPIRLFHIVVMEKYSAEGYAKKLEEAKTMRLVGKAFWLAVFVAAAMLFGFIREILEPTY